MKSASVLMTAALALAVGCGPENTYVAPPPPEVTVKTPDQETVTTYQKFTGQLQAKEIVDIKARVPGYLEAMHFSPGVYVEKGDLLFTIEQGPYQAALEAAEAKRQQTLADLQLAKATLQRKDKLFMNNAISELEWIEAQSQAQAAEGTFKAAEAAVTNAMIDLSYTKIHAPISGQMSRDLISVGNLVGSGDAVLLTTVVLDDPIYAYFKVTERDILAVTQQKEFGNKKSVTNLHLSVLLQLADESIYNGTGIVDYVDNQLDETTGLLEMRATFDNPGGRLVGGMFARVLFPQIQENALLVPDTSVQRDIGGVYLLLVGSDGTVEQRYVKLGQLIEGRRIIKEGLKPGEQVVIQGLQRARPGSKVTPKAPAPDKQESASAGSPAPSNSPAEK